MSDDAFKTLKTNITKYRQYFIDNPQDGSWINNIIEGNVFETKKYTIEDFELLIPTGPEDKETDLCNSIKLHETLKSLPPYVLAEPRFWLWLMFEKAYEVSLKLMETNEESAFKHQWLFIDGERRGLFFGILSRCFYRVDLSYDENNKEDPYHLASFAIEEPGRFREITWRAISNNRRIVRLMLKAEKKLLDDLGYEEKGAYYQELAKEITKFAGIKFVDVMSDEDIESFIYNKLKNIYETDLENQKIELYEKGIKLFEEETETTIKKAIEIFNDLSGYKESTDYLKKCEEKLQSTKKKKSIFSFFH